MTRFSERNRESGQSCVELAIMGPVLVILLAMVIDMGAFAVMAQTTTSAADAAARAVESQPTITQTELKAYVERAYPQFDGNIDVKLKPLGRESEPVNYRIYSPSEGDFKARPATVASDRFEVEVAYTGRWMSPVLMAASRFTNGDGTYTTVSQATASADATMETW